MNLINEKEILKKNIKDLVYYFQANKFNEAENLAKIIIKQNTENQISWKILGAIFRQSGRFIEALEANQKAVELIPNDAEALMNLGIVYNELGNLIETEKCYRQAIELKPDFIKAYINLGNNLKDQGKIKQSENCYRKVISIDNSNFGAYNNLGNILKESGNLEESEINFRRAIALYPNYSEAYNNLANVLIDMKKFDDGEINLKHAISLNPNLAEAYNSLGLISLIRKEKDNALKYFKKAIQLDPNLKVSKLFVIIIQGQKNIKYKNKNFKNLYKEENFISGPIILERKPDRKLINFLYDMNYRNMDNTPDTRFGNGKCSKDYNLFNEENFIIKKLSKDMKNILEKTFKKEIYIYDSFFNIYSDGSGITTHNHITKIDNIENFNLSKNKYSLVYYLSVGDQEVNDPGILKFYQPDEKILPSDGMIVIFSANRNHSTVYNGKKDRIIVGINFYCL